MCVRVSMSFRIFPFFSIYHLLRVNFSCVQVRKGDKIGDFLRAVQQQLAPEFREIRTTSVENLLYVKEDLIIPHVRLFWNLGSLSIYFWFLPSLRGFLICFSC